MKYAQPKQNIFVCKKPIPRYSIVGRGKNNTFENAKYWRQNTINQLKQSLRCRISIQEKESITSVIKKLKSCIEGHRCGELYCHACMLIRQNRIVGAALKYFEGKPVHFLTIAPEHFRVDSNQIHTISPHDMKKEFIRNLKEFGIYDQIRMLGFVESEQETTALKFHFHFHAIATGVEIKKWREFRKRYYRRSGDDEIYRPMMIKEVAKERRKLFAYILKKYWSRVSRWKNKQGQIKKRKYAIRHQHFPRHILWLDRYTLHDIMIMVGMTIKDGSFSEVSESMDTIRP